MSTNAMSMCFNPLIQLKMRPQFPAKKTTSKSTSISARNQNSQTPTNQQQQQLNLSVLRFTFGIPGLDESYLPRWIGYGFGSLLILNHFVGSDSSTTTLPQLRIEALGLSLAAFSIVIPYLGKFLKLISIRGELCARGYWNIPEKVSKTNLLAWFRGQMERIGLENIKDTLYFPQGTDSVLWEMLPKGTRSLLVEPVLQVPNSGANQKEKIEGFVLLASGMSYAYSDKDRAWIGALANKFGGAV
ncbi:hypothetical protein ACJW30_12G064600 [Castanea mollissima]